MNIETDWWNDQGTIWHIFCGGVAEEMWEILVIELHKNPEPSFLERPQRVVIQIIDNMIRGQQKNTCIVSPREILKAQ